MKKILVPTDFSEQASNALQMAAHIAQALNSELYHLHVIPSLSHQLLVPVSAELDPNIEQQYLRNVQEAALSEMNNQLLLRDLNPVKIHNLVEEGAIFQSIQKKSKEIGADLIIMGTQGTQPIEEIFIGSNTEKIVRHASCPVLTVRQLPDNFQINKIVFGSDLLEYNLAAIAYLKKMQESFGAELHIVFVNSTLFLRSNSEIEKRSEEFIHNTGLSNLHLHVFSARTEEAGILNAARKLDADLIVVETHQRKGLSHFFLGSTAEDLVNHAQRPVLTIGKSYTG